MSLVIDGGGLVYVNNVNKSNGSDTSENDTNTSGTDNDDDEHINDYHNKSEDGPDTSAFF